MCGIIIVGQGVAQVIISIQEELNMKDYKLLNRERVRAYVAQLIAAQGTTEGKMEGGAEC